MLETFPAKNEHMILSFTAVALSVLVIGYIFYALLAGLYVHREPWMDTVIAPMGEKLVARTAYGQFVLAPKECVDVGYNLMPGCEDRIVVLPIKE